MKQRKEFEKKLNNFLQTCEAVLEEIETFAEYLNDTNDWCQYGNLRDAIEDFIEDIESNPEEAYYIGE